jgi:hypothetical protein
MSLTKSNCFFRLSYLGDILYIEQSGHFTVDVVLESLFMRAGKVSDDVMQKLLIMIGLLQSPTRLHGVVPKFWDSLVFYFIFLLPDNPY